MGVRPVAAMGVADRWFQRISGLYFPVRPFPASVRAEFLLP
jgi:hypothetical protein